MSSDKPGGRATGLIVSPWNLLLLIPFISVVTPIFNSRSPELFGMPFFYWFQLAVIPVGVLCTIVVYRMTRNAPARRASGAPVDVDKLDEGSAEK